MLQNQRKLDQVIKRERLLAWVAMQSILEHEHSQFDRKFHYMEVLISDLWGPPSYYVILQG